MISWLLAEPGRMYVLATLLPLGGFTILLLAGALRQLCKTYRDQWSAARFFFYFLGGNQPIRSGAYFATALVAGSALLGGYGLLQYLKEAETLSPIELEKHWSDRSQWVRIGFPADQTPAVALELGYRIDHLTAILFAMVTFVATCIFVFSLGYMKDETAIEHEDHEAHVTRPGRFGRFFLFLSLFTFSMLNLLIADNLFQVFISWELVGVCSFFLIGFYHERNKASLAANKAFIVNRIGDAGFLIGLAIVWTTFGTFNFVDLQRDLASGVPISQGLLTLAGLGIFLGCVGKSAQFPLHTWLPDAMEGPTPVSALIHAATMVAAGVYLVGRAYPLMTDEARLIIAYTGCVTLFLAATIAIVQTDIKRVLAYSTVSQLGFMMLALGVGGWVAGLLHLLTHAFFKALLFLGSGSVIHGCHHEQDLMKMGGLRRRMPITACTMLVGVLAIAGTPFFSGWYSKDWILSNAMGFALHDRQHLALFIVPLVTAGITSFYMFRLWFLAFAGSARDPEVAEHAHESPWVMTAPLVVLAILSIGIAWGWPLWDPHASQLAHLLEKSLPASAHGLAREDDTHLSGWLALAAAALGFTLASALYLFHKVDAAAWKLRLAGVHSFLMNKWHFDEAYHNTVVQPTIALARGTSRWDKETVPVEQADAFDAQPRPRSLDGGLNTLAYTIFTLGGRMRQWQSGSIRQYVTVLIVTVLAVGMGIAVLIR